MTGTFEGLQYSLISSVKRWDEQYNDIITTVNEQRGEIHATSVKSTFK